MIVKLFDKNMNYLQSFDSYGELIVTEELEAGYKTIQLLIPYSLGHIQEEQKIEVDNYVYVIKEVNMENQDYYTVYGKPYFSGLLSKRPDNLIGYNMVLEDCLRQVLDGTDWTYVIEEFISESFTVNISNKTVLEVLTTLKSMYNFNYTFDTKNKVISFWKTKKIEPIHFTLDSENLRSCRSQSNSYDLITRLIPIGKDGTLVTLVNNNCAWVEDYSYTNEIILGYWIASGVSNADNLLQLAKTKIAEISHPATSYKIALTELPNNITIGSTVRVVDKIKGIDTTQTVQKIVRYDNQKKKSYIEVGSLRPSFDIIYKRFKDAQENVNENTLQNLRELNILDS